MNNKETIITLVIVGALIGFVFAVPKFFRYQSVQDADNQIYINEKRIHQNEQLVKVEQQNAQIRVEQAKGIAEANRIINASLTDKYLTHEAIQAQREMAGSPNHTQIYIPVGNNGIPIVKTIDDPKEK